MSQNHIQTNFNSGEWSPTLNARVDLAKYHSGAALLRNFFVDYRGGASNRPGTKYVLQGLGNTNILTPFQASFGNSYVLVFSQNFVRFVTNGSVILENGSTITNITQANPAVVTVSSIPAGYGNGNWVYISSVNGMTQVNGKFFVIANLNGGAHTFELKDLFGNNVNSTSYGAYTGSGLQQKVYEVHTPYQAADIPLIKYAQNANQLILTHPNYPPYVLTLISANNWTLAAITFGATVNPPTAGLAISTTLAAGNVFYAYRITSVDANGQESGPSAVVGIANLADIQTNAGSITISWTGVSGALSYNVYKSRQRFGLAPPTGAAYGFAGNCTGTTFIDSFPGIAQDFAQSMPIVQNPFTGSGVSSISLTGAGSYFGVKPSVTIDPPGAGTTATADVTMIPISITINFRGFGAIAPYALGDQVLLPNGIILTVLIVGGGQIVVFAITNGGTPTGSVPPNSVGQIATTGRGLGATFDITYGVATIFLTFSGDGYGGAPNVAFSPASATAITAIGTSAAGNPSVPAFSQQRLLLAAPPAAVNTLYGSQPGSPFNFNVSDPKQADDALQASIVSNQLNTIKSMIGMPSGLIVFTDRLVFQVNGGGPGTPFTAIDIFAHPQSYVGSNDIVPITANMEILFVQAKGSVIRNLSYNFYANVWTGTDVSVLSSHLFYGFQITSWCWAEEPFKTVWAVRNDGTLLSLAFLKEQELVGWAHHDTANGLFKSVCSVTETVNGNSVDAVYAIVQRVVNNETVQYIERFAERFVTSVVNGWFVDAGLQYQGSATTTITGLDHLAGLTVTGLADGKVIPPTVVAADGSITLGTAASSVTVGLGYIAQLQTLALDIGEPTIQGKRKSISAVTVRVADTLGLSIGSDLNNLVVMKDLIVGNLNEPGNYIVTDLVTGDARTVTDPSWTTEGQYAIQQSSPYPVSILGVIPEIQIGDTK